ncbi:MAG: hypothetical protein NTZ05_01915 [Chloroflexi bacterium]|nr:hypothetical protein [Chloroflexota bacterium]
MPATPSPFEPCPHWPADLPDERGCERCPLARCIYDTPAARAGRPLSTAGIQARQLLHLPIAEIMERSHISRAQAYRLRKPAPVL